MNRSEHIPPSRGPSRIARPAAAPFVVFAPALTIPALMIAALMTAACGDPTDPEADSGTDASIGSDGGTRADGGIGDAGSGPSDAGPVVGSFADPCVDGSGCASGICVPTGVMSDGCSRTCDPASLDCLAGWSCGTHEGSNACLCVSTPESCNSLDDDCDGIVDEGAANLLGCTEGCFFAHGLRG